EDRPMFESEPSTQRNATHSFAAIEDDVLIRTQADTAEAPPPTGGTHHAVIPTVFDDRSTWETVTVGPADGRTAHWPVYFRDLHDRKRINPATPEAAFEQYLQDDRNHGWSGGNATDTVVQ